MVPSINDQLKIIIEVDIQWFHQPFVDTGVLIIHKMCWRPVYLILHVDIEAAVSDCRLSGFRHITTICLQNDKVVAVVNPSLSLLQRNIIELKFHMNIVPFVSSAMFLCK